MPKLTSVASTQKKFEPAQGRVVGEQISKIREIFGKCRKRSILPALFMPTRVRSRTSIRVPHTTVSHTHCHTHNCTHTFTMKIRKTTPRTWFARTHHSRDDHHIPCFGCSHSNGVRSRTRMVFTCKHVVGRLYKPSARKPWLTVYRARPS